LTLGGADTAMLDRLATGMANWIIALHDRTDVLKSSAREGQSSN